MWKPVQLQGSGECTTINAVKAPTDKLRSGAVSSTASSPAATSICCPARRSAPGHPNRRPCGTRRAPASWCSPAGWPDRFERRDRNRGARIDGFTIRGADTGGGIIVNGYADYLQISNNRIANNSGFYGGGIRVGHPTLTAEQPDGGFDYTDGHNDYVSIHHNQVVFNGGLGGVGGGISMCTGADSYRITENWVCGNFSLGEGGGIGHTGRSDGSWVRSRTLGPEPRVWTLIDLPLIADNTVIFNESFFQGSTISGGGIFIGGAPALPLAPGGLTPGAGNVQVIGNLIQGNSAGAGDGGGIRLAGVNGQDVADNPNNDTEAKRKPGNQRSGPLVRGGRLQQHARQQRGGAGRRRHLDARRSQRAPGPQHHRQQRQHGDRGRGLRAEQPQPVDPAGRGRHRFPGAQHELDAAGNVGTFSDPSAFADNIIWQNRQFFFFVDDTSGCTPGDPSCMSTYGVCPDVTGGLTCPGGTTWSTTTCAAGRWRALQAPASSPATDPLFVT